MKPWEKSWDSQQQGDQKPWEKSWGQTTQLLEDAFGFGEEPPEYNAFRSGAVDLLESAVGLGDELDAVVRQLTGEATSWDEAITQSRKELAAFEKENPLASKTLTGLGIGASLFIPALGMTKIAKAGSMAGRVAKGAGLGAAEGAAYGFLTGQDEGRLEGAAVGAGLGGVLGGIGAKFLTKGEEAVKETTNRTGLNSYIGGEDGFVRVGKAKEDKGLGRGTDTSTSDRVVTDVFDNAPVVAVEWIVRINSF